MIEIVPIVGNDDFYRLRSLNLSNNPQLDSRTWKVLGNIWSEPNTKGISEVILNENQINNSDLVEIMSSWASNMDIDKFSTSSFQLDNT